MESKSRLKQGAPIPEGERDERRKRTNETIQIKDLVKEYEIGEWIVRAVDEISFAITKGEYLAVVGPSGAGKTTLLNLLGGLDRPTSGTITFFGVNISAMVEESLASFRVANVGFVFQNYNLISTLTAAENILFPMELAGYTVSERLTRVAELLNLVNLKDRDEHLPSQLSAGEQQRVGIARALANDPPVILADEPTANLDKRSARIISDLFGKLKEMGKTVVVVTHDDDISKYADRVVFVDDGKIKGDDEGDEGAKNNESTKDDEDPEKEGDIKEDHAHAHGPGPKRHETASPEQDPGTPGAQGE